MTQTTLARMLRTHCDETGESMRALSLRAGQNQKCVSDIVSIPGLRPRRTTLEALSRATGLDLTNHATGAAITYRRLIDRLDASGTRKEDRRSVSRLRWLMRRTGWVPETRAVCLREVAEWFAARTSASVDLTAGSFGTYKSEILGIVRKAAGRSRPLGVADLRPAHREVWDAIGEEGGLYAWEMGGLGGFVAWLDGEGIRPPGITAEVLNSYYAYRLDVCGKSEKASRRQVKEIAASLRKIAAVPSLAALGFSEVDHPFADRNGRFGVPDAQIVALMDEFDGHVVPWARGQASRSGTSREEFLARLDEEAAAARGPVTDKKARLLERRERVKGRRPQNVRDDLLRGAGFLTPSEQWAVATVARKRGQVVSLAKALLAAHDTPIESVEELPDPDYLEPALEALADANAGGEPSSYIESILKTVRKIALGYVGRAAADVARIDDLRTVFAVRWDGLAPRVRKRLHQFDEARIQRTIDLGATIVADVDAQIERRRTAHRKEHGFLPARVDAIDAPLAQDVMAALAHGILMTRAPRSANVIGIRLDWIAWPGDRARITVPAVKVKAREAGDADLKIDLNPEMSRLLRTYLDRVRAKALRKGDETNPYLFPSQGERAELGTPYKGLLRRLCRRMAVEVGVETNPHLYRHLLGLIWLREDPGRLPQVQRLLGHKSITTTMEYYVEFQEEEVQKEWQKLLEEKAANAPNAPTRRRRSA
jgi:integrase